MLGQGIVDGGEEAGVCFSSVFFSCWEEGGGKCEG
jgi:hypothetical protein